METEDKGFSPPYNIPWATFHNTIEKVAADLPNRIDRSYLASRSGSEQSYLIYAFRGFGLIEDDGTVTDELRALAKDTDGRPAAIALLLKRFYPAAIELGQTNATPGELDAAFATMFPRVTGASRVKAIRFFLAAMDYAVLQRSPLWKAPKTGTPGAARKANRTRKITPSGDGGGTGGGGGSGPIETKVVDFGPAGKIEVRVGVKWLDLPTAKMVALRNLIDDLDAMGQPDWQPKAP